MSDLTAKQYHAIYLLVSGHSRKETAEMVGCGLRTLQSWLADCRFTKEFLKQTQEVRSLRYANLAVATIEAIDTLREIMNDRHASPTDRIRAADHLLKRVEI